MIHDCSITLSVPGKPDQSVYCQCPDDACFDQCQADFLKIGADLAALRASAAYVPGNYTATLTACSRADGAPDLHSVTTYSSLSAAALAAIEGGLATFCNCASAKKAKAVKR